MGAVSINKKKKPVYSMAGTLREWNPETSNQYLV